MKPMIKEAWESANKRVLFMVGLVLAIWLLFHFLSGGYVLRAENLVNLFKQVAVVSILATGMTLVIVSNNIDLSVGSALGMFGALAAALVTQAGLNSFLAIAVILLLGMLVGCLHGFLICFFRIPAFVVTLGGLIAYRGIAQYVARQSIPVTTGWIKGISQGALPDTVTLGIALLALIGAGTTIARRRGDHRKAQIPVDPLTVDVVRFIGAALLVIAVVGIMLAGAGFPVQVVIFLALAFAIQWVSRNTRFGRYVYAIGGNSQASHYSGINTGRTIMTVFGLMGFLSALAGIVSVAELNAAPPDIGDLKELEAIAACVLGGASLSGGVGSVLMSMLGAMVMASIKNGMSMVGIVAQMQKVILGSLLVIAVGLDAWSRRKK